MSCVQVWNSDKGLLEVFRDAIELCQYKVKLTIIGDAQKTQLKHLDTLFTPYSFGIQVIPGML